MDSILNSIKKLLGYDAEYTHFDADIIMYINATFSTLHQLGVGPTQGFVLTNADQTWSQFLENRTDLESVKTYIYLKVRLIFDPPATSYAIEAMTKIANEFEWRLTNKV